MRRVGLFLVITVGALAALVVTALWYLAGPQYGGLSSQGLMGQMMGGQYGYGGAAPAPAYVPAAVLGSVILLAAGVAGLAYYVAFPQIRAPPAEPGPRASEKLGPEKVDWSVLLRTSKPDERKVLEVLASHGGTYLQKFIVKEAGLSKLKTHRVVSRYAERGVLVVTKSGNTNQVTLAPWLKRDAATAKPGA